MFSDLRGTIPTLLSEPSQAQLYSLLPGPCERTAGDWPRGRPLCIASGAAASCP